MPILEQLPLRRVTLSQALDAMAAFPVRRAQTQTLAVKTAEGRILAADAFAPEDVPPFRRSRVDGFAVVASDVQAATPAAPVRLRLLGEVLMGHAAPCPLSAGQAVQVPTGGALPSGATGVVMLEDAKIEDTTVTVLDGSDSSQYVTEIASDVRAGERLFAKGTLLSPAALGLLAAAGVAHIPVFLPPTIGLIVTGDELASEQHLRPGEIHDVNSVVLPAAIIAMGFRATNYGRVSDERSLFESLFRQAIRESDGIVVSGGSSVGERDYTPQVVAAAGRPGVVVHGIKAKPGRPALLGMIGEQPVFGLPGNPVSALTVLEALAKPVLLRMFDKRDDTLPLRALLALDIDAEPELEHRIPVRLELADDHINAHPLLGTSAQMHIMGKADGMLVVPLGAGGLRKGSWVNVIPFSRTHTLR